MMVEAETPNGSTADGCAGIQCPYEHSADVSRRAGHGGEAAGMLGRGRLGGRRLCTTVRHNKHWASWKPVRAHTVRGDKSDTHWSVLAPVCLPACLMLSSKYLQTTPPSYSFFHSWRPDRPDPCPSSPASRPAAVNPARALPTMSRALLLAAGLLLAISAASAYQGDGTAYSGPGDKDATGRNACGFGRLDSQWERMYGAMNHDQFPNSCGKCVRVRGTDSGASGKSFLVMIVDECPECKHGDIDFSTAALQAITGFSWDRKSISWDWDSCDGPTDARKDDEESSDNSDNNDESDKKDKKSPSPPKEPRSPPPPSGQPTGTYRDWVLDCSGGHKRCSNLALASQGYQCANLKGDKCCLTDSGDNCVKTSSVKDDGVEWDGERPQSQDPPSPPPKPEEEEAASPAPPRRKPGRRGGAGRRPQRPQRQQQKPGAGVVGQVASAATDAFAAAAAAIAKAAGGGRKLLRQ
ncbi:hypothetical protein ABPG75_004570 [Micractinium tetrahymenae]